MKIFICARCDTAEVRLPLYRKAVQERHPFAVILDSYLVTGDIASFVKNENATGLLDADLVAFLDDWHNDCNCRIAHYIAFEYGIEIEYLSTIKPPRPVFKDWESDGIRYYYDNGKTPAEIAEAYKATVSAIERVLNS